MLIRDAIVLLAALERPGRLLIAELDLESAELFYQVEDTRGALIADVAMTDAQIDRLLQQGKIIAGPYCSTWVLARGRDL